MDTKAEEMKWQDLAERIHAYCKGHKPYDELAVGLNAPEIFRVYEGVLRARMANIGNYNTFSERFVDETHYLLVNRFLVYYARKAAKK